MTKALSLYILVDGQPAPFPSADEQIVLDSFSVRMQRMGLAPSITADVMYRECLDGRWEGVFTVFKGERFYVKTEPDTSKDSTDVRYRHSVTFVSERKVLDDVYMVDAVSASVSGDGYKSNDTRVVFSGNITQWAARLNAALEYCGLYDAEEETGYRVVVDQGVSMDDVLVSFEEKYISEALQEGYKAFGIPYYFKRNENVMEIHMGDSEGSIDTLIQYGPNDALLSIERRNANIKMANRMSGYGSSDNLPYYYPNDTPIGNNPDLEVEAEEGSTIVPSIRSAEMISSHISDFPLTYSNGVHKQSDNQKFDTVAICDVRSEYGKLRITGCEYDNLEIGDKVMLDHDTRIIFSFGYGDTNAYTLHDPHFPGSHIKLPHHADSMTVTEAFAINQDAGIMYGINPGIEMTLPAGIYSIIVSFSMTVSTSVYYDISFDPRFEGEVYYEYNTPAWRNRDEHIVNLDELGIDSTGTPVVGDVINLVVGDYIEPIGRLMPPIYKESGGTERFYNAINHTTGQTGYPIPGTDPVQYYHFDHPYSDSDRRELIQEFSDIKPTITGVINSSIQRIDQFLEVAFDDDDNDDKDADGAYLHPYFFVKLPKTDGQYGFNIFDCVSDKAMTLVMTSGVCGSCKFEIGVDDEYRKNTVQVDENGDLVRNDKGDVVCGREGQSKVQMQARQQDSENYEVWIALKKDNKTYPSIMPSYNQSLRPAAEDDTFVLVNINMPSAYIRDAEERLKIAIIEQMSLVNSEIFNPGIEFSRVFLEEHPFFLASLTENSKLTNIVYNGVRYGYYVSELTYTMSEGDILPELSVSLVSELKTQSSTFETRLEALKQNIVNTIDRGFNASYFATAEQGRRADSALQNIKVGDDILEKEGADGNKSVLIPYASSGKSGVVSADDQTFSGNKTFDNQVIGMQGVSAKGIPDLTLPAGTGGGKGTVTKIEVNGIEHEPDADGKVELPDYPADFTEEVEALQGAVSEIEGLIPEAASDSNPLVDTESMNDAISDMETQTHASSTYATKTDIQSKAGNDQIASDITASNTGHADTFAVEGVTLNASTLSHCRYVITFTQAPSQTDGYGRVNLTLGGFTLPIVYEGGYASLTNKWQEGDTMDVWYQSGAWHLQRANYPHLSYEVWGTIEKISNPYNRN